MINSYDKYLIISKFVIRFIISFEIKIYKIEIMIAVKKLNSIEFFTVVKKVFCALLPKLYPTTPSVEKA